MKTGRCFSKKALPLLYISLLLLAGCGAPVEEVPEDSQPEQPYYETELTEENLLELTVVNASEYTLNMVEIAWASQRDFLNLLHDVDWYLGPGESMISYFVKAENGRYSFTADGFKENDENDRYIFTQYDVPISDGSVIVVPPGMEYPDIQNIFEAGTDPETARQTTVSQYQEAYEAEKAAGLGMTPAEVERAANALGYNSLAEMRTDRNPDISFMNFTDEDYPEYYKLYGYWYPNGDRNSVEYFAFSDEEIRWYRLDPEQGGDVEVRRDRLVRNDTWALHVTELPYTLSNGDKFTLHLKNVFTEMRNGTITFDGNNTEFCSGAEFSYSKD